jgi:hypothetical protein
MYGTRIATQATIFHVATAAGPRIEPQNQWFTKTLIVKYNNEVLRFLYYTGSVNSS